MIALPEDSKYSSYYLQAILNCKYVEWFSSLYGEIFRGGYIARGTKVLNQLPIRKIDFDNDEDVTKHNNIAVRQKALIELGDRLVTNATNKRRYPVLKRQFDAMKVEQDNAIRLLYDMNEIEDSRIPIIKELYAAD